MDMVNFGKSMVSLKVTYIHGRFCILYIGIPQHAVGFHCSPGPRRSPPVPFGPLRSSVHVQLPPGPGRARTLLLGGGLQISPELRGYLAARWGAMDLSAATEAEDRKDHSQHCNAHHVVASSCIIFWDDWGLYHTKIQHSSYQSANKLTQNLLELSTRDT